MRTYCNTLHAATLAEALADDLPVADVWRFLRTAPIAQQAEIFSYFPLEEQIRLVEGGGKLEMARLIEEMSSDDRAELLRRLRTAVARGSASAGGRGRPPRHRAVSGIPRKQRRRLDDHRLRLAARQHHRRGLPSTACVCRRPTAKPSITSTLSMSNGVCSAWFAARSDPGSPPHPDQHHHGDQLRSRCA